MESLLVSALVVAIAEIGDKTQLLAIILATRFKKPVPIILGILVATLANHALAATGRLDGLGPVRAAHGSSGPSPSRSSPWPPGR
jgi:hypothetical protein